MTRPIHYAVIGAGGIGSYHVASIAGLEAKGVAKLVAVADPNVKSLATSKADLAARGVHWYLNYRDLLDKEPSIEAVVIATPIPLHFEITMECLARGLRIHLEKPPVPLLWQLEKLIAAERDNVVSVGFQYIAATCTQKLKHLIAEGKLGEIREIRAAGCWPRYDRYYNRAKWAGQMIVGDSPVFDGPATNAMAHVIHSIMFLAGDGLEEFAVPAEVEGELYRARRIASYDTACLRGRFGSGAEFSAALTHSTENLMPYRIEIVGTKGWAKLSQDGARLETSCSGVTECTENTQELLNINHANFNDVLQGRANRFLTRLADTRGYVSATNAMLVSSGGIHKVDSGSIRGFMHDGTAGCDVSGLRSAVESSLEDGRLFSEHPECAWAGARPQAVSVPPNSGAVLAALCKEADDFCAPMYAGRKETAAPPAVADA
jgi:predicted dehydrogenase